MTTQGDLFESRAARDSAIATVAEHNDSWLALCVRQFEAMKYDVDFPVEFTGENMREWLARRGLLPTHENAWGALTMAAARRKLIEKTGGLAPMKAKSSHGRLTQLWRFT